MVLQMLDNDTNEIAVMPYQELEKDIWLKDICAGCRGCIAVCPTDALTFDSKLNRPSQVTPCVDCKACLDVCPRMPANIRNLEPTDIIGHYLDIKNIRSKMSNARFQI